MSKRSLVSLESMPSGWLNTDEGAEWFSRRASAFEVMAHAHAKVQNAK